MVRGVGTLTGLAAAAAVVLAMGACRPGTVELAFTPHVGDEARYRYEIDATLTQALDGSEPRVTEITTTIETHQQIVEVGEGGARAEVTLRRDGAPAHTASITLDRSGSLEGIGLGDDEAGPIDALGTLLSGAPLPHRSVAPGSRWRVSDHDLRGEGRLVRLGVVDGRDTAVVASKLTHALDEAVETGSTTAQLTGALHSATTSSYDLADGALRQATTRADGRVRALIKPPAGVDAAPAKGTITYAVHIVVTRLG